jgi:hypothetical protein
MSLSVIERPYNEKIGNFKRKSWLLSPSLLCGLFRYFFPSLSGHACRPRLPALTAKFHRRWVFPVIRRWCRFVDLACGNPADHDGGTDHVSGALLAFRASGHLIVPMFSTDALWAVFRGVFDHALYGVHQRLRVRFYLPGFQTVRRNRKSTLIGVIIALADIVCFAIRTDCDCASGYGDLFRNLP